MKENKYSPNQSQIPASDPQPVSPMTPAPDDVARRAYFAYVNNGSLDGYEVQHWLTAEAELTAERNRSRVHGYENKT
jgi:hypothetical protein